MEGGGDVNQRIFLNFISFSFSVLLERPNICRCPHCVLGGECFCLPVDCPWTGNREVVGRAWCPRLLGRGGPSEAGTLWPCGLNRFPVSGSDTGDSGLVMQCRSCCSPEALPGLRP